MNAAPYHSALHADIAAPPAARAEFPDGSVALHRNLMEGLTADFDECDVLYTELPWQAGFAKFNARAQCADLYTYGELMAGVSRIIRVMGRPTVIVTGQLSAKHLPKPLQRFGIKLNGGLSVALCYGLMVQPAATTTGLLQHLASRFARVGDFCCGYGSAARAFRDAGKRFTASDYNARCIGYIAKAMA